ncbi:MAG: aldehyde ferredoxin oxidoreductase N-terminal domain-containing protein, partial [Candidatus Latescibacteria bacterium]|nr:aldehyde ferredoxin oxidoreductase N-terminal domain-containing protein [Candidatus Latescibacterota bacterium]
KYAGYDGLIVTGQADRPIYLWIEDDRVEIRDASHLWGHGILETQRQLLEELGQNARILTIGQAGENLCRIAIIATETESAAGQGGFGAVMGSKRLKAIVVRGHGAIRVADPGELLTRLEVIREGLKTKYGGRQLTGERVDRYGLKYYACTQHCPVLCATFYGNVPGVVHKGRVHRGLFHCCAPGFPRAKPYWDIGFEAGFEIAQLANDYGLNHWEFRFAIGPWIYLCQQRGELLELGGDRIDLNDPHFWALLLKKVAFREDWGDAFAEGGRRLPDILGIGKDLMDQFYPAWGQASHWDGHGSFAGPSYPYWLVTALQWAMDTRDPLGGGHGHTTNFARMAGSIPLDDEAAWEKVRRLSERIYGSAAAADPWSGYEGKAHAASYHCDMNPLKDALGICDNMFPLIVDLKADDLMVRARGVEGRFFEHFFTEPALGLDLSREEFYQVGARIFTLERALQIRNWGRTRQIDETIVPYLARPEVNPNPFTEDREAADPDRFRILMDEYYDLRNWDRETGRPTRPELERLGLRGIADQLGDCDDLPEEVAAG